MVDAIVIGAGIAGVAAVDAWRAARPNAQLALVDATDPDAGARAPGALLHIAPGRSFAIQQPQADAFLTSVAWLKAQPAGNVVEQTLVRPLTGPAGRRLEASLERGQPMLDRAGVRVEVIDRNRIVELLSPLSVAPEIQAAFAVSPSYAVALRTLLATAKDHFGRNGGHLIEGRATAIAKGEKGWTVRVGESFIEAPHVVVACGARQGMFVDDVGEIEGGDLLVTAADKASAMVTGGGVHGCGPPGQGWVVGATRYAVAERPPADVATAALLHKAAEQTLGVLPTDARLWRGQRLVGAGRQPHARLVFGTRARGVWAVGGFGGTGLLWAPATAKALVNEILSP